MRRITALSLLALTATLALPTGSTADQSRRAPDCRFDNARAYEDFGRIRVFSTGSGLYGCLTDVGRAYRLDTGTMRARAASTRETIFGVGDWVAFPARDGSGDARVRATNLRTGRSHAVRTGTAASAIVVNFDGTLAWIAGTSLRTKALGVRGRTLASDGAIDRRFLGLENDQGCAVTWKVSGVQRSSSIHCTRP
jgi:hypothetical protein